MNISETNGKDLLEKYNKLSEKEKVKFWRDFLLLLALGDKTSPTDKCNNEAPEN